MDIYCRFLILKKVNKFSKSLIVDNDAAEKKSVLWIIEKKILGFIIVSQGCYMKF